MSQINMDERFGGNYQFVRKDEVVVSYRDLRMSMFGKVSLAIVAIVVGVLISLGHLAWKKYELTEIKRKNEIIDRILSFHHETSDLFLNMSLLKDTENRDEARDMIAYMIVEASNFKQYSTYTRYSPNSAFPGFTKYPSFDEYHEALSDALVYVHTGEGNLENILIRLVETREKFLREYSNP